MSTPLLIEGLSKRIVTTYDWQHSGDQGPRGASFGMPDEDWGMLFNAIVDRLRRNVISTEVLSVRTSIEGCAQDLEMLHAALDERREHSLRIETQLQLAREALARQAAEMGRKALLLLLIFFRQSFSYALEIGTYQWFTLRRDAFIGPAHARTPAFGRTSQQR